MHFLEHCGPSAVKESLSFEQSQCLDLGFGRPSGVKYGERKVGGERGGSGNAETEAINF